METNILELNTVTYDSKFNEYAIDIPGCQSYMTFKYCPWCGKKLPNSMRTKWFKEVKKFGVKCLFDDNIENLPDIYKDDRWYNK